VRKKTLCFVLHSHLVFVTKKRGKVFAAKHLEILRKIFQDVCSDFEVELKEFSGECDHVHLLVFYPPKLALSSLVNSLKGVSSRLLKKQCPEISHFWSLARSRNSFWSPSYFAASCGGAPIDVLKNYIQSQKTS